MSEESPQKYSLRLSGEGIHVEQEIEKHVALQVVQVVMGGGVAAPLQAGRKPEAKHLNGVSLSLREHLDNIGASKKPEQIATIAHYICEIEGQSDFSREDIRSRFISAREPPPANFPRDFSLTQKNGWIAEVHGKKDRFYVTAKGAQAINGNFSNEKGAAKRR